VAYQRCTVGPRPCGVEQALIVGGHAVTVLTQLVGWSAHVGPSEAHLPFAGITTSWLASAGLGLSTGRLLRRQGARYTGVG
jgi:hypothetical protein